MLTSCGAVHAETRDESASCQRLHLKYVEVLSCVAFNVRPYKKIKIWPPKIWYKPGGCAWEFMKIIKAGGVLRTSTRPTFDLLLLIHASV